jgi:hypothetical protein
MGGTSYGGNELGHGYEGINISDPIICQRAFTVNKLKECLFKEKIILIRSPPMAGKTSLAQLLEKQLLTDCPDMRIIRISLLWMEDDDPNWKFSDRFSWLMGGTGWRQFVAECSYIETVLIVDEVQKIYRLDSENAEPRHEGKEFWNTFKDIQQYSRLYIVAFASYGYHGAYDYNPNSDDIMKISPFQLSEHNTWGLKEIRFTSEEYNDYVTNFSRSKLNLLSQQDEDNLLNYIRQCTLCHPGLVTFILNHIFERFVSQIKQNEKRLTFSEIFKYLKSYNFYASLMVRNNLILLYFLKFWL